MAAQRGTALHQLANDLIKLGVKLPDTMRTMNMYVNDGIGFRMTPEQTLYVSDNCFGTADTLSFRNQFLRIHDLKTGLIHASPRQLEIYAAMFCLEYGINPFEIVTELRIYQNDDVAIYAVDPDSTRNVMDRIIVADRRIQKMREENE